MEKAMSVMEVQLGGETRRVEYTLYSIARLKQLTGKNAMKGEVDTKEPDQLIAFAWAGLISHDKELDGGIVDGKPDEKLAGVLKEVGRWVSFERLHDIMNVFSTAFLLAMPDSKKEKDGAEKK